MTTAQTVDLRSVTGWEQVLLPDSSTPVSLARLRISPRRGLTALVWYPPGWEFTATGNYAADLDLVVFEGALTISGTTIRTSEYVYLETGYFWNGAKTVTGALVIQRFSDAPRWVASDKPRFRIPQRPCFLPSVAFTDSGQVRDLRKNRGASTRFHARLEPFNVTDADTEVIDTVQRRWFHLPLGVTYPETERAIVMSPAG